MDFQNYVGQNVQVSPFGFPNGVMGAMSGMQNNAAALSQTNLDRDKYWNDAQSKELLSQMGGFERDPFSGKMRRQQRAGVMPISDGSTDAPPATTGASGGSSAGGDMMSQILAAIGGLGGGSSRPFQGTTNSSTNIADVGSVATEGTMPYEIAALNAGTASQGNILDLISKLFGTQGGVETARIGAGAQMHGHDTGLEGTKYGADANTKQAQIAADAARAVAETNQTPARLQSEWRNSQIGNLLGARSRPSASGDATDVTPVMAASKDGGLGAIIKKLLAGAT